MPGLSTVVSLSVSTVMVVEVVSAAALWLDRAWTGWCGAVLSLMVVGLIRTCALVEGRRAAWMYWPPPALADGVHRPYLEEIATVGVDAAVPGRRARGRRDVVPGEAAVGRRLILGRIRVVLVWPRHLMLVARHGKRSSHISHSSIF